MFLTAYNPTDSPVVVAPDGRNIGGRAWGAVDTSDEDLWSGFVFVVDHGEPSEKDERVAAYEAAVADTKRRNELAATTKAELAAMVEDPDGKSKDDLVDEVARAGKPRGKVN